MVAVVPRRHRARVLFGLSDKLLRLAEKSQFLGEHLMSVEDAATTAFSADHETAVSLLHCEHDGVSAPDASPVRWSARDLALGC